MRVLQKIAEYSKTLSLEQQKQILETIEGMLSEPEASNKPSIPTIEKTSNPNCPYCISDKVNKMGTLSGRQRYICKSCKKLFTSIPTPLLKTLMQPSPYGKALSLILGVDFLLTTLQSRFIYIIRLFLHAS